LVRRLASDMIQIGQGGPHVSGLPVTYTIELSRGRVQLREDLANCRLSFGDPFGMGEISVIGAEPARWNTKVLSTDERDEGGS